ncbi:TetR/AcrR family transcriptional regulator [Sansalvadorimonas sp. 2012CJ34-2]|uniref:TetR/AcrR family transcriptional regulator n=1 Tax=Parendozoicomonas callyspongiae TaxID=2942213 RepID=A0ABT0PGK2_9GAMM|nr:TetR/AcrR family transcriptional regulator [Sansalvadorimonas sp. 2012CJ34-2]MCL6270361.1 TetR/AcrR family transcriptional regulator [Sansalvadorimonas sp. 2012CJ34-2]
MGRSTGFDRSDVLERAMDLFWRNGFSETSLRQLEEATGLNPGSIYYHFHNKSQMFQAVLIHYIENRLLSRLAFYMNRHAPLESLRLFFTTSYRQEDVKNYRCGCLLVLALTESHRNTLAPILKEALGRVEQGFSMALEAGGCDPSTSRMLLDSYIALQLSGHLLSSRKNLDQYVKEIFARLATT